MSTPSVVYKVGTLAYTKRALVTLCLWLLWGDFCFMLMETVVPSIMPLKFKALGAPNAVMGMVLATIPGMINTALNPVISFKSDRFRSRWGRRIPFIVFSLPFLVLCLIGLGYGDKAGFWLHARFENLLGDFAPASVAIVILGAMVALFSFFNTFVNSVFWYLFNDVVPEQLLGRFMSWFRMVSLGAAGVYNLFIFKHAESHSTAILVGAGVIYFFGFGLMCLKVKEGRYPPPPAFEEKRTGVVAAIRTYGRECLALPHYWFAFLANMGIVTAYTASTFTIFFYQSMGLTLEMVGRLAFVSSIAGAIAIPVTGWLADRHHPIRIVMIGAASQVVILPLNLAWLFWQPASHVVYYTLIGANLLLFAPVSAMLSVMDPPLFMRLFPRERYGQFCSANSMLRSIAAIVAGLLIGVFLDVIAAHWGQDTAYRCLPLWNLAAYVLVLFAMVKLYRSWKRFGGDSAYVAPVPGFREKPAAGRRSAELPALEKPV